MSEQRRKHKLMTAEDVVVAAVTLLVLGNGVLAALTGSSLPTLAAVALILFAGRWGNLQR